MANHKEIVRDATITFRVLQEDKEKLQAIVKKEGYKSLSSLMEEICLEFLSRK